MISEYFPSYFPPRMLIRSVTAAFEGHSMFPFHCCDQCITTVYPTEYESNAFPIHWAGDLVVILVEAELRCELEAGSVAGLNVGSKAGSTAGSKAVLMITASGGHPKYSFYCCDSQSTPVGQIEYLLYGVPIHSGALEAVTDDGFGSRCCCHSDLD